MPPKLLHNSLIGWGSLFGATTTKATPVGLIGLPLSGATMSTPGTNIPTVSLSGLGKKGPSVSEEGGEAGEVPKSVTAGTFKGGSADFEAGRTQFHHSITAIAAGTRHIAALTSIGNIIAMGSNRYGQVGQPVMATAAPSFGDGGGDSSSSSATDAAAKAAVAGMGAEQLPYYYDLGYEEIRRQTGASQRDISLDDNIPTRVASGCNHNLFFRPGTTNVICFGNNNVGQLGLGHKQMCLNTEGFAEWDRALPWARPEDRQSGIADIVCGQMHTLITFRNGAIYGCGSNLVGELGVGDMYVDGQPRRIITEGTIVKKGKEERTAVRQVAAGMNFTLFLTNEGRVYSAGSNNSNQIAIATNTPEPFLINRGMISLPSAAMMDASSAEAAAAAAAAETTSAASSTALVRIRHIGACTEMGVFVTSKNEVLVRGVLSDVGFVTGSRFHAVLPLPEDRCADGRAYPHYHPEIVRVVAKESNVLLVYADGRVVGFGSNNDGQVKMTSIAVMKGSEAEASVAVRGVGGSTAAADGLLGDGASGGKRAVNLELGKYCNEVALVLPKPLVTSPPPSSSASSSAYGGSFNSLHLCHGFNFGFALDTNPACGYEEALVAHYRRDREARRARGEATESVLMTEAVFPPIPPDLGAKPAKRLLGGGANGGNYRRAVRGPRVASGLSPAAAAAVMGAGAGGAAGAGEAASASSAAAAPSAASTSSAVPAQGGSGKVSMEEMIRRRRSKLSF